MRSRSIAIVAITHFVQTVFCRRGHANHEGLPIGAGEVNEGVSGAVQFSSHLFITSSALHD